MNDDFVNRGIENDRYLKATRLIDRFETEMRGELERVSEEFVEENRNLFIDDPRPRWNHEQNPNKTLAFARIDRKMDRMSTADSDAEQLKLNTAIRWLDPSKHGIDYSGSVLCLASYKIKDISREDHERVKERTRFEEDGISYYPDPYGGAPDEFYVPVESAEEIKDGFQRLRQHFSKHGSEYGVDPNQIE